MDKISVVVVDDHPIFLAGLQQLFKKQPDFELVGVAENAAQLEAVLTQTTPAVILMDIEMPERDGISATAFVRKHAPGTKVVMLTGYDNPDLIFRALKAGSDSSPFVAFIPGALHFSRTRRAGRASSLLVP